MQGGNLWSVASRASAGLPGSLELLACHWDPECRFETSGFVCTARFQPSSLSSFFAPSLDFGVEGYMLCHCVLELQL